SSRLPPRSPAGRSDGARRPSRLGGWTMNARVARVEPFFESLVARDAGGRSWLPSLLAAAPHGRERLETLVDDPGSLVTTLAVRGVEGRLGCFEALAAPPRELLEWYVEHPDALARP